MAKAIDNDQFEQKCCIQIKENGPNCGGITEFPSSISPRENSGIIIHEIVYRMILNPMVVFDNTDAVVYVGLAQGLPTYNEMSVSQDNRFVDWHQLRRADMYCIVSGTAQVADEKYSVFYGELGVVRSDFRGMKSGGLLASPNGLNAFVGGISLPQEGWFNVQLFYTIVSITPEMWREFSEMRLTTRII